MSQIQYVKLNQVIPSPRNPRKTFDQASLEELAESIKQVGVLSPIIVREIKQNKSKKFELVCGERRFRACSIANLDTIPVIIRELSDDEAMDLMITENLQRKEISPIEEAAAFKNLIDLRGYNIEAIGDRFGKSYLFVKNRIRLNNLTQKFKELVESDLLSISAAVVISKYNKEQQDKFYKSNQYSLDIGSLKKAAIESYLESMFDASFYRASFDLSDETLDAPACVNCPQNSSVYQIQFDDGNDKGKCMNSECFNKKNQLSFARKLKEVLNSDGSITPVYTNYIFGDEEKFVNQLIASGVKALELSWNTGYQLVDEPELPVLDDYDITDYDSPDERLEAYQNDLTEYNKELEEFESLRQSNRLFKGFLLNSSDKGSTVYFKSRISSAPSNSPKNVVIESEISELESKITRNNELKQEKIYVESITKLSSRLENKTGDFSLMEKKAMMSILLQTTLKSEAFKDEVAGIVGIESSKIGIYLPSEDIIRITNALPDEMLPKMFRVFLLESLSGNAQYVDSYKKGFAIELAKEHFPDEMKEIVSSIDASYDKKNSSIQSKISDLKTQIESCEA